jgi:leucyl aminopeptidase (aminopeptidase T)
MNQGSSTAVGAFLFAGLLAAAPALGAAPDTEQLAQRLVAAAAVKEGETVLINGQARDAQLLEDIAVNVRKVGAFPLVTYESDRLGKRLFFDVPAKYDTQTDGVGEKLAQIIDVSISVSNGQSEDLLAGADPKRLAARGKANEAIAQAMLKRNVRSVEVGNGFYPTPWRAQRYGMSEAALADTFWQAVNLDYSSLQSRAEQVKSVLAAGDRLHITNPNGTDLTVSIKGRPVLASDGTISAEDIKAGGGAVAVYLPAGEVYTAPVPGTANGKVVHTRDYFRGKAVDNLTMQFKDGKLTSLTGSGPGYADLRAAYDAVNDPRKDLFGFVDLGINPNVKLPANSQVGSWIPAGTVSVGIAGNTWAGGDNSVPYGLTAFLPGSTVTLDGKPIIEGGQLKL